MKRPLGLALGPRVALPGPLSDRAGAGRGLATPLQDNIVKRECTVVIHVTFCLYTCYPDFFCRINYFHGTELIPVGVVGPRSPSHCAVLHHALGRGREDPLHTSSFRNLTYIHLQLSSKHAPITDLSKYRSCSLAEAKDRSSSVSEALDVIPRTYIRVPRCQHNNWSNIE